MHACHTHTPTHPPKQGDILEDIELIENLEETKRTAVEIEEKVAQAKLTEVSISAAREVYRPVAARGSQVYFLIDNLNALDRCGTAGSVYVLSVVCGLIWAASDCCCCHTQLELPERHTRVCAQTSNTPCAHLPVFFRCSVYHYSMANYVAILKKGMDMTPGGKSEAMVPPADRQVSAMLQQQLASLSVSVSAGMHVEC